MDTNQIPMVAGRKASMPMIYGDTPSFLGCPIIKSKKDIGKYDVALMGVPWEGTVTWGTYSGCELAPKTIRQAAARYGGYLPEYDINCFDYLNIGDFGDVSIVPSSPEKTMKRVNSKARDVYAGGAVPFSLGGDHSFTPEIVAALAENGVGKIGVVHFDAHLDNSRKFGKDRLPRCGPLYRTAQIPQVKTSSIVHFGIRGPRNSPAQAEYARSIGATVITTRDVRETGVEEAIGRAIDLAFDGTDAVYITICSDVLENGFNPGGAIDFDGLSPHELFYCLHQLGKKGIAGLDYVEVYPLADANGVSSHLASWALVHALIGMAAKKQGEGEEWPGILQEVEIGNK